MRARSPMLAGCAGLLAACSKPEPPPEPVRPVQLAQVEARRTRGHASVFAGESQAAARKRSRLSHRRQGHRAQRRRRRARDAGPGAGAARSRRRRLAGRRAKGRRRRGRDRIPASRRPSSSATSSSSSQKFISASALDQKRNALDVNRAQVRAGAGAARGHAEPGGYAALVAPENGVVTAVNVEAGQVVTAGQVGR